MIVIAFPEPCTCALLHISTVSCWMFNAGQVTGGYVLESDHWSSQVCSAEAFYSWGYCIWRRWSRSPCPGLPGWQPRSMSAWPYCCDPY